MDHRSKASLIGMLQKDSLSCHEAGTIIKALGELLQDIKDSMLHSVHDEKEAVECMVEDSRGLARELLKNLAASEDAADNVYERIDDLYSKYVDKRKAIMARLDHLPELPVVHVPRGVENLIDIAERCTALTDAQWARVIELAKALREES